MVYDIFAVLTHCKWLPDCQPKKVLVTQLQRLHCRAKNLLDTHEQAWSLANFALLLILI